MSFRIERAARIREVCAKKWTSKRLICIYRRELTEFLVRVYVWVDTSAYSTCVTVTV